MREIESTLMTRTHIRDSIHSKVFGFSISHMIIERDRCSEPVPNDIFTKQSWHKQPTWGGGIEKG